jgi:radical SAM protein with 4Fe4S-binding SPASM domain
MYSKMDDFMLSKYVVETEHEGTPVYFNTVTKKYLPKDSCKEVLEKNHFLSGSEMECIDKKLAQTNKKNSITIICTWECNLRCNHCTVLKKLVKKDPVQVPIEQTVNFIKKFAQFYPSEKQQVSFIGGEPLLNPNAINEIISKLGNTDFYYSITTNLAVELNNEVISCLSKLDQIAVSIDGDHKEHNSQRKSSDDSDPFLKSFNNIKTIIKKGFKEKITIQSALRDEYVNNEHKKRFFRNFLKLGIKADNIIFGCHHPVEWNKNETEAFKYLLSKGRIINQSCCMFRINSVVLNKEKICTDYYTFEEIGTIYDDIVDVHEKRKKLIKNNMPVLNDSKCKECPVLGACWGGCSNGLQFFKNPSEYCDQEKLIQEVQKRSEENKIIEIMKGEPCL